MSDRKDLERRLVDAAQAYQRGWISAPTSQFAELAKRFELAALALVDDLRNKPGPCDCPACEKSVAERDEAEDLGTELAEAVGKHFGIDVGEHSNCNDPRRTALEVLQEQGNGLISQIEQLRDKWRENAGHLAVEDFRISSIHYTSCADELDAVLAKGDE